MHYTHYIAFPWNQAAQHISRCPSFACPACQRLSSSPSAHCPCFVVRLASDSTICPTTALAWSFYSVMVSSESQRENTHTHTQTHKHITPVGHFHVHQHLTVFGNPGQYWYFNTRGLCTGHFSPFIYFLLMLHCSVSVLPAFAVGSADVAPNTLYLERSCFIYRPTAY